MDADHPRALLLSGSVGMGHDVVAEACATSLERRGWSTATLDSLRLMGGAAGGISERAVRSLLSIPGVFDAFHFEQLRPGGRLARFAASASSRLLVPALQAELEGSPVSLVVSVYATAVAAVGRVKARHPNLKTAVFCTDACPHWMWTHDSTDLYIVTSETAHRFVRRFHPDAEVAVVPTPVRRQFHAAPTRHDARQELGIADDAPCALLMTGGWGLGPLAEMATTLADAGVVVLAVAGRNASAEAALRESGSRRGRLFPFGFTDRIPTLMAASDLVVTTSGDTCSEARVVGRHLLLLDIVPGHGRENLQLELERGSADVAPTDPGCLRRSVLACLDRVQRPTKRVAQTPAAWEAAFDAVLARVDLAGVGGAVDPR